MKRRGMSLVEVLVALVVIVIAVTILATAVVSNLQQTARAGNRTQTTQYLAYFGRKVAGGDAAVLAAVGSPLAWGYGDLAAAFDDLPTGGGGLADANRYRAVVTQVGQVAFVGASAVQYSIDVCTTTTTGESCVAGNTLGPPPTASGGPPPLLPGIN
jgi:prepilin-type N-terminal cleavage/methylation domain-containing protein